MNTKHAILKQIMTKFVFRVRKLLNLRIFDDDAGKKWNKSVSDKQYEILCVSQVKLSIKQL